MNVKLAVSDLFIKRRSEFKSLLVTVACVVIPEVFPNIGPEITTMLYQIAVPSGLYTGYRVTSKLGEEKQG